MRIAHRKREDPTQFPGVSKHFLEQFKVCVQVSHESKAFGVAPHPKEGTCVVAMGALFFPVKLRGHPRHCIEKSSSFPLRSHYLSIFVFHVDWQLATTKKICVRLRQCSYNLQVVVCSS